MDKHKILEQVFYVCKFCDKVFDSFNMAELHVDECLQNYEDNHSCITCGRCAINLVPPTDKDNGYKSLRLQDIVGVKAYLTCEDNIYNGKLTEEKILRMDKTCYKPMNEGDKFIVIHSDSYKRYKGLMEQADKEQDEIDKEIKEYWDYVRELDEAGYTTEEIAEIVSEKYSDEEN